jgi:starch phosphorylase
VDPERSGERDLSRAAELLADRIPAKLAPLARLALNYRWCWLRGGEALFAAVDADRWEACGHNPFRLLQETPFAVLERAAADAELRRRAGELAARVAAECAEPASGDVPAERPVAFFCAEYGVHASLPIYAGGLGVLAGDLLKAASDRALALVAVGLLYRQGYLRQRIDVSGWQHEYWVEVDPHLLPAALVTRDGGEPLLVSVPLRGREVWAQIWRVDVGRVPLFLLDADRPENRRVDRWINARLYVSDRDTRLAQYALLGIGGVRALNAMGIEPGVIHLNEGHAAFAPLELAASEVARGGASQAALAAARARTVFTTHTPIAAGNESWSRADLERVVPDLPARLGIGWDGLMDLLRDAPGDPSAHAGPTQLGLRMSRSANAVSRRHGETAREMWRHLYPGRTAADVPIGHVTNGVHVGTWMAEPLRELLDLHLGPDWELSIDPAIWARVDSISDADLWRLRCDLRRRLVEYVRDRATIDRLARGEPMAYVELAARAFDPERLTIGFARRLAEYKRMHLLTLDLERALRLLGGSRPVQILLAGKAHPQDEEAKRIVQRVFQAKGAPFVGERIAYLHDYDLPMARMLVAGCDVWMNLPRPPLEASGTSGMKAAMNGGLHLSVLDGWWPEAFDGQNGFSIEGEADPDHDAQDKRHAEAALDRIEREAVPLFYERDDAGLPRRWLARVRGAIRTAGLRFSAQRMLDDYVRQVYRAGAP